MRPIPKRPEPIALTVYVELADLLAWRRGGIPPSAFLSAVTSRIDVLCSDPEIERALFARYHEWAKAQVLYAEELGELTLTESDFVGAEEGEGDEG